MINEKRDGYSINVVEAIASHLENNINLGFSLHFT